VPFEWPRLIARTTAPHGYSQTTISFTRLSTGSARPERGCAWFGQRDLMPTDIPASLQSLARHQAGIITAQQALQHGLTRDVIRARLASGRWQRCYPGVLAVFSGQLPRSAQLWAAVTRVGPDATLSHYTAAELAGLLQPPARRIHVSVPASRRVDPIAGIALHRSRRLAEARHPSRVPPQTRIEETVLDLADLARTFDEAFDWLCRACGARLTTADRLGAAMQTRNRVRWRSGLATALCDVGNGVQSWLEYRYVRNVERPHALPSSESQVRTAGPGPHGYRDFLYRAYGVVVETDGQVAHPESERWRDLHRDNAAAAAGLITLRYSWSDVYIRACEVAAQVAAVLSLRGWPGDPRPCGPSCPLGRRECRPG
jgi:predicted transcriptional regulator of viral defense system